MFSQPKKIQSQTNYEDMILENLANAYKCYIFTDWVDVGVNAGTGGFLIKECINDSKKLKSIAIIIGKGLLDKKEDAKTASFIFDKLYKDGFKNGLFKDAIQNRFKEVLSEETIKKLNEGAKMADCMQKMYIDEESMIIYREFMGFSK